MYDTTHNCFELHTPFAVILYNSFSDETRATWIDHWYCMRCRSNQMVSLHHLTGRKKGEWWTCSRFNSMPLCHECHEHALQNDEWLYRYLPLVYMYQIRQPEEMDDNDRMFLYLNRKYFKLSTK